MPRRGLPTRGLALASLLLAAANLRAQTAVEFTRVDASPVRIAQLGLAVIRDSAQWATLWRRWEELRWSGSTGEIVHATVPQIDFRREMLIAVALGWTSGCSNVQHNVGRVVEWKDSIVISPPAGLFASGTTCAMIIEPVDVVRVPRSDKRVVFRAKEVTRGLPAATWWWSPSATEFEAADTAKQAAFAIALIRDPATPVTTVRALARYAVVHPGLTYDLIAQRPEVRASVPVLTLLAGASGGDSAVAVLFRDFGTTVASDPSTPRNVLIKFTRRLGSRPPPPRDIVTALLKNPTVAGDSELVVTMVDYVRDPALRADACRLYLARWTNWQPATNPDGSFIGWNSRVSCPNMPPHPPR